MKSLYTDSDNYSIEASRLDLETHNSIKDIFVEYQREGYSVRQISQIMQMTVIDLELSTMLSTKK